MSEPVQDVAGPVGDAGPATLPGTKGRLPGNQAVDAVDLELVVAAVNALVHERWHPPVVDGVPRAWSANHQLGANQLAARLYMRRNSPAGVLPFGEIGTAYVQRTDPDVALLLGLGVHSKPGVA